MEIRTGPPGKNKDGTSDGALSDQGETEMERR